MIFALQEKTGWTHNYILWHESWANIHMKLVDAPRISTGKKKKAIDSEDELYKFLNLK